MQIDLTGRKPTKIEFRESKKPSRHDEENMSVGDDVEVEVVRNGKTLYKGR